MAFHAPFKNMPRIARYDTRALTRHVAPLILRDGRNPSPSLVREYVRNLFPDLADVFTPSEGTIQTELVKIRKEWGEQLESGVPGVPREMNAHLLGMANQALTLAREEAQREVAQKWQDLRVQAAALESREISVTNQVALLEQRHQAESRVWQKEKTALAGDLAIAQSRLEEARRELDRTAIALEAAHGAAQQQAGKIAELEAGLRQTQEQAAQQIALAEERYRELEKMNLAKLEEARMESRKHQQEVARATHKLKALESQITQLHQENAQLNGALSEARKRISDLANTPPSRPGVKRLFQRRR